MICDDVAYREDYVDYLIEYNGETDLPCYTVRNRMIIWRVFPDWNIHCFPSYTD